MVRDYCMKKFLYILLLYFFPLNYCDAQFKKHLDSLCVMCNHIISDSEKVVTLGKIADLYYSYHYIKQGDSVLHDQLLVAELSLKDNLILAALFDSAIIKLNPGASTESFNKAVLYLQKGIDFAKQKNKYDFIALGYTRMAHTLQKRGQTDKAMDNSIQALQLLPYIKNDSVKAIIYIALGYSYQAKNEAVSALTNYNSAFDIALKLNSIPLLSEIYHRFSELYFDVLENTEEAKGYLNESLRLDKAHNYMKGVVRDYYDLARFTNEKFYIEKTIALSDSLHLYDWNLAAKRRMLYYYMLEKNYDKALMYLENDADLNQSFRETSIGSYYQTKGEIFYYANKFDSAKFYFNLSESDFNKNFDEKQILGLYREIAGTYENLNDLPNATAYFLSVLSISKKLNNLKIIASTSQSLSSLYERQGNYKQAIVYSKQANDYSDSLRNLSKAKDLALLNVDREKRRHEDEIQEALRLEKQKENNKRDIQYMAITIAIAIIFLGLLVIGMFAVSKMTIKILGYFFFISLFEFIVMIIDNSFLARLVHNEPLKLWVIKIVLIACLVPLQHFLEYNLIKFLESRKLLEARTKFSFRNLSIKKWMDNIKKPTSITNEGIEEDTAVL